MKLLSSRWIRFFKALTIFSFFAGSGFFCPDKGLACTLANATLSFGSDDAGEIFINGNLVTLCPNGCWTGVNNANVPIAWINPVGDNVLAAYSYAIDVPFSACSWLLTLTYSDCGDSYAQTSDPCVLDQYLFDPNSATGPPPIANFPAGWNNTGFNESSWVAPAITAASPPICATCDNIPAPLGGIEPWTWGNANWLVCTIGDGYMFREHFQVGVSGCSTATPTPAISSTPTLTPTVTITSTPTLTPTVTPTFTPTCVPHVWPDPFNPKYAVLGFLNLSCLPAGANVSFYTVSGELVNSLSESGGIVQWNGRNRSGVLVSSGIYFYVIQAGQTVIQKGKFLVANHG